MNVGYALIPEYEGKGYATEAASFMVQMAFTQYDQTKISAITSELNVGSCRVLEKIGFKHQSFIRLPQGNEDLQLYLLEKKDFSIKTSDS